MKKVKALIALVAVVAMVAVSSVAYAQSTFTVTASVASLTSSMDATDCTTTAPPSVSFTTGDYGNELTDDCSLSITSNTAWNLTGGDADNDTGTASQGNEDAIPCTATCDTTTGTGDFIDGATDGDVTAGIDDGEVGYYLVDSGSAGLTPANCDAATSLCDAVSTQDTLFSSEGTAVNAEAFTYTFDAAIDNDTTGGIQAAGTYSDTWQLTFS